MSIVLDPLFPRNMKLAKVAIHVETDSIVHRCDRCRREEPCEVIRQVETDHSWENGSIRLASLPAGWVDFQAHGFKERMGNPALGRGSYELCPDCAPAVRAAFASFLGDVLGVPVAAKEASQGGAG